MPLTLRPLQTADIPAIVELMNRAFRGTGPNASWNTESVIIDGDRTSEAALLEQLRDKPEAHFLIAEDETTHDLRGCVWLEPMPEDRWYLGSLTIDPALQKSGLGRELLTAAEAWAFDRGCRVIEMTVVNQRTTLIAWYERRGYQLTGETHPFPYEDARFGRPRRDDLEFVVLERELLTRPTL